VITRGLPSKRLALLYRILGALCALAAVWTIFLSLTGGFSVELGGLRIASRRPRNAAVISLVCAMLVWLLSFLPDGRTTFRDEWSRWRRWYASMHVWRGRTWRVVHIATSTITIAVVAICIDIYVWRRALPLWVDEEMIALNFRDRSMGDLAGPLWLGQSAPFGWLVLERTAMTVLGTGETALRAVPLLFGIATVGVAVWVGQRWMGRIAAAVFVVLCWISPLLAHYRFEVKHYTADILFGLLLPALAVWATEADRSEDRTRRVWLWWIAAVAGHWVSNGALFVAPACAIFLSVAVWRRDGGRAAAWCSLGGLMWLASFGLSYLITLRYTLNNTFLRSLWITEMLPPSLGITGTMQWFLDRLEPLALNPGGTALWTIFWASAICGWAFSVRRPLGLVLAGVPVSAFALAAVVPLHQRFSIWMVPALYTGVALLIDRAIRLGSDAVGRRRWALLAVASLVLFVQFRLCADILTRGKVDLDARRRSTDKHRLDDRAAVRWLMSQWKPGDVLMTTHLALPAVWWYGMIPISDEGGSGSTRSDGSPVYEIGPTTDCPSRQFEDALKNHGRVLLYLGFDVTPGFDRVLLTNLAQFGGMSAYREFSQLGLAAVIDSRTPASGSIPRLNRTATSEHVDAGGCVGAQRAARW
jgi:hypothetical protein